jgi:hypothetical protein
MKRVALALVVALLLGVGTVIAAGGASIDTFPVSFVLTSAGCSNLPPGTTVAGSGTETSITSTKDNGDGTVTLINATHAKGTATDQSGNTYVFQYSNEFRATNSAGDPDVFSGFMTDSFSLAGRGPAKLNNGFYSALVTDFATFFTFDPISDHGDPIDFPTGTAHCDPL